MDNAPEKDLIIDDIYCWIKSNPGYQSSPYHYHNIYEILLLLGGDIVFYNESKAYALNVGDVVTVSPSKGHRARSNDSGNKRYERIVIYVSKPALERLSTDRFNLSACLESDEPMHLDENSIEEVKLLAEKLSEAVSSNRPSARIEANAYLSLILLKLCESSNASDTHRSKNLMPPVVSQMIEYVSDHLSEDLSFAALSEVFYNSVPYISEQFKKHTGLSLKEYIQVKRIEEAKHLLSEGASVSAACYDSGFNDYSNFIRSFTKAVGISPGRFARQKNM